VCAPPRHGAESSAPGPAPRTRTASPSEALVSEETLSIHVTAGAHEVIAAALAQEEKARYVRVRVGRG
jgi:hypothetical protein